MSNNSDDDLLGEGLVWDSDYDSEEYETHETSQEQRPASDNSPKLAQEASENPLIKKCKVDGFLTASSVINNENSRFNPWTHFALFKPLGVLPVAPAVLALLPEGFEYKIQEVRGDGNCFFSAVALALKEAYGQEHTAENLRERAVTHMATNPHEYLPYFLEGECFDTYISEMRNDGTWADYVVINALASVLSLRIDLIDLSGGQSHAPVKLNFQVSEQAPFAIVLQRSGPAGKEHYDPIIATVALPQGAPSLPR